MSSDAGVVGNDAGVVGNETPKAAKKIRRMVTSARETPGPAPILKEVGSPRACLSPELSLSGVPSVCEPHGVGIDASTPDGARHRPRSDVLAHGGLGMMHSRAERLGGRRSCGRVYVRLGTREPPNASVPVLDPKRLVGRGARSEPSRNIATSANILTRASPLV